MFEDIAIQYANQSEDQFRLIAYGLVICGAVVAGLFHKSRDELQRAPYFVYSGLLFLLLSASRLVWLGAVPALTGGYLWVLMTSDVVSSLAVGYGLGVIATARSRDAAGHGRLAALAFIPLANLWLYVAASKKQQSANRVPTIPLISGGLGAATGFVLLIASLFLGGCIRAETARLAAEAQADPAMRLASFDSMLASLGLEETLQLLAAEVTRQQIDENMTLLGVEGDGKVLRFRYEISTEVGELSPAVRTGLEKYICASEDLRPIIQVGASVEQVYRRTDGRELGTVEASSQSCGFEQTQSGGE